MRADFTSLAITVAVLAQLAPLIVIAAVCWGVPRIRRSTAPWEMAFKTAPLGCFAMIVLTVAMAVALSYRSSHSYGETIFYIAIFVGGVWAAYLLQRWLLRRAGVEPRANIWCTLAVVLLLALLSFVEFLYLGWGR